MYPFDMLAQQLDGDIHHDMKWRLLYATDASAYRDLPAAVCRPAHAGDIVEVLNFCREHELPVIPRTAGTSLAGQVVGRGLVLDFSKYMNRILELNTDEAWVKVEPGVILDELNAFLKPHGLFFGPETSTSNRCMIGGMVANNACGSHSLVYGSTRDHTPEIEAILSDGSTVLFKELTNDEFRTKCIGNTLENNIYNQIFSMLSNKENRLEIKEQYPDPRLRRRNTGYALDLLAETRLFDDSTTSFNFCKMLAGSEGSLAIFTAIKLNLVPLPPPEKALVCVHLNSVEEALHANLIALKYKPVAVELIDKVVLDCTKTNITQQKNRFFIKGDPGAILIVEFAAHTKKEIEQSAASMELHLRKEALGSHFPLLFNNDIPKVWALRKAGLGLLSNVPGDAKPVAVIEDTAVHVEQLPDFIRELQKIMSRLGLSCVYHAHIGTGELHLRPVLNLKNPADVERFYQIAKETAHLVKKYRGSLSGEHGDGRLRAEFIPVVLGEKITRLLQEVKQTWDPHKLLNPGKIVFPAPMRSSLRYSPGQDMKKFPAMFRYPDTGSFLGAVEKCNGSGDCRKPHTMGGVMCPSYHATLDEDATTRGRANLLREFITHSPKKNPFHHREIAEVLDLCISCKACKAECPANVDMAKYKAEAMHQYYLSNGIPIRAKIIGAFATVYRAGSTFPGLFNALTNNSLTRNLITRLLGFAKERPLPRLHKNTLRKWASKHLAKLNMETSGKKHVFLFCDEFTNYNDSQTGIHAILLLHVLGYHVTLLQHPESGRAYISKGLLKKATTIANQNVRLFSERVSDDAPLVGIEPSAILGFRDEYPALVDSELQEQAVALSKHVFTYEEFICREHERQQFDTSIFKNTERQIYFHGHCHQKVLSSNQYSITMMSIPGKTSVKEIECGCCGMAGSFGYEKEHYKLSMAIGELSLFPAIRQADESCIIAASGTSCRAQIHDGTGRTALHPIDVMFHMLKEKPFTS